MPTTPKKEKHDPLGLTRRLTFDEAHLGDPDRLLSKEWLVTNGLGGYASGTVAGACTLYLPRARATRPVVRNSNRTLSRVIMAAR